MQYHGCEGSFLKAKFIGSLKLDVFWIHMISSRSLFSSMLPLTEKDLI